MRVLLWAVVVAMFALIGCDKGTEGGGEGASAQDTTTVQDIAGDSECDPPEGKPGTKVGALFDSGAVLVDCDGNPVRLADVMCGARLSVVEIGAGWCQPCIEAASQLEAKLVKPFSSKGLQVISILFEDQNSKPANAAFCRQWRDQFDLTTPVLVDPTFKLRPYFDDNQQAAPVTMLVNSDGVIVHLEAGIPPTDLDKTIEVELNK